MHSHHILVHRFNWPHTFHLLRTSKLLNHILISLVSIPSTCLILFLSCQTTLVSFSLTHSSPMFLIHSSNRNIHHFLLPKVPQSTKHFTFHSAINTVTSLHSNWFISHSVPSLSIKVFHSLLFLGTERGIQLLPFFTSFTRCQKHFLIFHITFHNPFSPHFSTLLFSLFLTSLCTITLRSFFSLLYYASFF